MPITSHYPTEKNWDGEFPAPKSLSENKIKEWEFLTLDDKIQATLKEIEEKGEYGEEELRTLKRCWAKSSECSSVKKIIEIRQICLNMSSELKEKEEKPIVIVCRNGNVNIPSFYKELLAKDSPFFEKLFFSKMQKKQENQSTIENQYEIEIDQADFEELLDIWSNDLAVDPQKALELLEISCFLTLKRESLENAIIEEVKKTWSIDHEEDVLNALALSSYSPFMTDTLKTELWHFLAKIYLKNPSNSEHANNCLEFIKALDLTSLTLNNCVNEAELLQNVSTFCPNLKSLTLNSSLNPDGALVVKAIMQLSKLTSLNVSNCPMLTDESIDQITQTHPNLTQLSVPGCNLTDQAIELITTRLPNLTSLDVSLCYHLTDHAIAAITTRLHSLRDLKIIYCSLLTNQAIEQIAAKLPHLTSLDLSGCLKLTDRVIEILAAKLPLLSQLNLTGCLGLTGDTLSLITTQFPHLKSLTLAYCKFPSEALEQIGQMSNLISLDISGSNIEDKDMEHIAKLSKLQSLNVRSCPLTDKSLRHIFKLNKLSKLDITRCNMLADTTIEQIETLTQLTHFSIGFQDNAKLNDNTISLILDKLPKLTHLTILACRNLSDHSIAQIADKSPALVSLNLYSCRGLTQESLKPIARLAHLTTLNLGACFDVIDESIAEQIAQISNLTTLDLSSDGEIKDLAMQQIVRLPLKSLNIQICTYNHKYLKEISGSVQLLKSQNFRQ